MIENNLYLLPSIEADSFHKSCISKVFTLNPYPEKLFNNDDWCLYTLYFNDTNDYSTFRVLLTMARALRNNNLYINASINSVDDFSTLKLPLDIGNVNLDNIFENHPYCACDYIILGEKNDWGIYVENVEDFAILGCSPEIKDIVEKHYSLFDDVCKMDKGKGLIDYLFDAILRVHDYNSLMNVYQFVEKIKGNYKNLFE